MTTVSLENREKHASESLYRLLRNSRPSGVTVVDLEGDRKPIGLKKGKGRWDLAVAAIVDMLDDVERVELLDDEERIVRTWKPLPSAHRAAGAGEDLEDLADGATAVPLALVRELLRMQADAADNAVKRHMAGSKDTTDQLLTTLKLHADQSRELMRQQSAMLRLAYTSTIARGQAEAIVREAFARAGNGEDDAGMDMVSTLLRKVLGIPAGGIGDLAELAAELDGARGDVAAKEPNGSGGGGESDPH